MISCEICSAVVIGSPPHVLYPAYSPLVLGIYPSPEARYPWNTVMMSLVGIMAYPSGCGWAVLSHVSANGVSTVPLMSVIMQET